MLSEHYPVIDRLPINQRDLLGLAWLCEQAACWRRQIGDGAWASQLFDEASLLRDQAVNR